MSACPPQPSVQKQPLTLKKRILYLLLTFVIGIVGVYDTVLSVVFSQTLPQIEMNPLCRWIIEEGGVKELVLWKSAGTLAGIVILIYITYTKFRICVPIVFFLALILFFYLTFYCPNGDYTIESIIAESVRSGGPLDRFVNFYHCLDFADSVEALMEE